MHDHLPRKFPKNQIILKIFVILFKQISKDNEHVFLKKCWFEMSFFLFFFCGGVYSCVKKCEKNNISLKSMF